MPPRFVAIRQHKTVSRCRWPPVEYHDQPLFGVVPLQPGFAPILRTAGSPFRSAAGILMPVAVADQAVEVVLPSGEADTVTNCPGDGEQGRCDGGHAYPDHKRAHCCFRGGAGGRGRCGDLRSVVVDPDLNGVTSFGCRWRLDRAGVFGAGGSPSGRHGGGACVARFVGRQGRR